MYVIACPRLDDEHARCQVNDDDDDALFIAFVPSVINSSSTAVGAPPRHHRRSTFRTLGSEPSTFHSPIRLPHARRCQRGASLELVIVI